MPEDGTVGQTNSNASSTSKDGPVIGSPRPREVSKLFSTCSMYSEATIGLN